MDSKRGRWKKRLLTAYWAIVGIFGIGQPIVDRRSMYGGNPKNDPYGPDYEPDRPPRR